MKSKNIFPLLLRISLRLFAACHPLSLYPLSNLCCLCHKGVKSPQNYFYPILCCVAQYWFLTNESFVCTDKKTDGHYTALLNLMQACYCALLKWLHYVVPYHGCQIWLSIRTKSVLKILCASRLGKHLCEIPLHKRIKRREEKIFSWKKSATSLQWGRKALRKGSLAPLSHDAFVTSCLSWKLWNLTTTGLGRWLGGGFPLQFYPSGFCSDIQDLR